MTQGESGKQDLHPPIARRNRTEAIGNASAFATQSFLRAGFRDPALVLRWREIVGAEVARVAQPLKLTDGPSGGVLTLMAEPAAAVFLQHETRALCERINAFLGRPAVVRLRFVKGRVATPGEPHRDRRSAPPAPASDPVFEFAGPDCLKAALVELARARWRPRG